MAIKFKESPWLSRTSGIL